MMLETFTWTTYSSFPCKSVLKLECYE